MGEIKPRAVDKHHPREGLSDGLLDYHIRRCGGQVPQSSFIPFENVAADPWSHSLSGTVCSEGQGVDAAFLVATEVALVFICGRSCSSGTLVSDVFSVYQLVVTERAMGIGSPLSKCSFHLFSSSQYCPKLMDSICRTRRHWGCGWR